MPDILHAVGIKATPAQVYTALTTIDGLAAWWTSDTRGAATAGDTISFHFGDTARVDVKVLELVPNERVVWQVLHAQPDWIGTKIRFELKPKDALTHVLFKHEGWEHPTEFMHHCSTKWATFLVSLKTMLEKGAGTPYPNDVQIAA